MYCNLSLSLFISQYLSLRNRWISGANVIHERARSARPGNDHYLWGSQGSILGTLLFLIYINDLNNSISKLSAILFADDTNLFCSGKDLQELELIVNAQLTGVQEWLTLNQLTLNIKKSKFIIFKSHKKPLKRELHLQLSGNDLQRVEESKFLGNIID